MMRAHAYCAERARGNDAPIATRFARTRKDALGTLIAGMVRGRRQVPVVGRDAVRARARTAVRPRRRAVLEARGSGAEAPARVRRRRLGAARPPGGLDRGRAHARGRGAHHRRAACQLRARLRDRAAARIQDRASMARDHQEGRAGQAPARSRRTRPGSTHTRRACAWSKSTARSTKRSSCSTWTTCRSRRWRSWACSMVAGSSRTTPLSST